MKLKHRYESIDQVPETFRELFGPAKEGTDVVLVGVDGILFQEDHKSLLSALDAEREARGGLEKQLKAFSGIDLKEVSELRNRLPELESALAEANESKRTSIEKAVEERLGPLKREYETQSAATKAQLEKLAAEKAMLSEQITRRAFEETLTKQALKRGVREHAVEDVIARANRYGWRLDQTGEPTTKREDGTQRYSQRRPTDPMTIDEWFDGVLSDEAPHVFKESQGGGADGSRGGGSVNKSRSKMTPEEKTAFVAQHGFDKFRDLPE